MLTLATICLGIIGLLIIAASFGALIFRTDKNDAVDIAASIIFVTILQVSYWGLVISLIKLGLWD